MEKIDVPQLNVPRIVIIGAGFAGIQLIKRLKNKDVQIVLFDRNNYHTFQPLLYQVATAGLEPDAISFPVRKIFKKYKNVFFRMGTVQRVVAEENKILTDIGELDYDYLVVATGSRTNFFGLDDVQANSMSMKTVAQSLDLRSAMLQNFEQALLTKNLEEREKLMNFVIVGGGPTGVELAGALGELKNHILPLDYPELDVRRMQIHLIEASSRLLPALSKKSSEKSIGYLKELGVNVWTNTAVINFDGEVVVTKGEKSSQILSKNVIWSAGVEGNPIKGVDDAMQPSKRIKVNEFNQLEEFENVFAIGDIAFMPQKDFPRGHPMVAPVAIQQGNLLAKNIIKLVNKDGKLKPFKYRDKGSMATIGKNRAVVEIGKMKYQGAFAWFVWMFVHIMSLVGMRNKAVVLINWTWNYINYDRGNRLIIRKHKRVDSSRQQSEKLNDLDEII
ncbi:NAD(P)/FAD-dependent oxidoreductase [Sediminitomix flava]|uniref:NADH:ubiquinone reductase (non-electrogenic) n=1 Tax=Sediminitomix flava TaxID=379075 RepID=A0A315Z789_SEDFL|nr:NAD(P)/FAD-dependent oxidoreductase [Sediminitomix flava]PWJ40092.1 NADH dehydrogenase [Sediminitomix flava]